MRPAVPGVTDVLAHGFYLFAVTEMRCLNPMHTRVWRNERGTELIKSLWLAALLICVGIAPPAFAFEEAAISLKELSDGSIVEYESSFCEVSVGETVSVLLMGDRGDAAEATIVATTVQSRNSAKPNAGKSKVGARNAYVAAVIGMGGKFAEITLDEAEAGWKNVHLQIEISTGDKLGLNLRSTTCASDDVPG
jgi:hypothetical protein